MGGKGGVLTPQQARQLMSVLEEMTEYVDGEELDGISAQKMIYEDTDGGSVQTGQDELPVVDLTETQDLPPGMPNEDTEEALLKKFRRGM